MELIVQKYDLQDISIIDSEKDYDFHVWQPEYFYIVIGRSNKAETSLIAEEIIKDEIPVYQRPSGGEAVILSQNTLVISVKIAIGKSLDIHKYFKLINGKLIEALKNLGIKNLAQKGISDISIGPKKILGSSLYKNKETAFYHAVLNVSEEIANISKYLKHPKKEPDYRKGRSHSEFVTSLKNEGFCTDLETISNEISLALNSGINN